MEKKQSNQKTKNFFKKNVYYIIMAICLLAIAAMITVTILINNGTIGNKHNINDAPALKPDDSVIVKPDENLDEKPNDNVPVKPDDGMVEKPDEKPIVKPEVIVMSNPVAKVKVLQGYSMDSLVWNPTLKHYAVHNGIDFGGAEGDIVSAAYDGTVESVTYDVLNGHTVTIKHNDKLRTSYSSLNEPVVKQGQHVKKGGKIGTMGVTATAEYTSGAHVHFCVTENNNPINPDAYLTISENK